MTIKKQPQIRFGGFGGDWEEKKLKDLVGEIKSYPFSRDIETDENTGFKYIHYGDIHRGRISVIQSQDELPNIKPLEKAEYLKNGDIVVADVSEDYEGIANPCVIACDLNENVIAGLHTIAMRPQQANPSYLYYLLKTEIFKQYGRVKGTGIKVFGITKSNFFDFECLYPTKPEQIVIGQFFRQLDEMLTFAEQKHAQTVQLKKAMLGKLFPISGSLQPQIRLKGFSGDWVERKLGDLGECVSGIGFPENEQGGKSGIPFYKVSDMNLPENNIFLKTANNFVTDEQIQQNNWKVITSVPCIFFAKVGAALLLNRKRLVTTPFLLDNNTMAFVIGLELHDYFAKILFDNIDLPKISQVGALPSINAKDVENIIVRLPETLAEQTAIGKLFQTLDHTIALQAKEITQIKQLKSALLGKMFV